jgi:hypothetical protein
MPEVVQPPVIHPAPAFEIPRWLKGVLPSADYQIEFRRPNGDLHFKSNEGPQTWGLLCNYEEMLVGGRRGGGKSKFLIAKAAMGDITLPQDDPARYSFLNDRDFRGLLLREEYQSMSEFVEEAIEFYKPFGGKAAGDPKHIDFPKTGARIYFNHINDEESFSKYKGWNLTFIGIEELTQVKTLRRYLKLLGSLRSVDRLRNGKRLPPLRTQIVSTTNPDGPGAGWVKERFVEVRDGSGKLIPWNTPMRDTFTGAIRIFIPFPIEANPFLGEETAGGRRYRANLMAQDEVTRKQWMEGDWNAGTGKFFKEYRPDGPIGKEEETNFPWARHIIKPVPLKPWYTRWGSGDTGYEHPSAFHKFCRNAVDKRVHVYDEMQLRRVGYFEQGALLAKWWLPELEGLQSAGKDPCITLHIGHDAFSRTDVTKTKAEQIEAGIREVLGPYGAVILKYNEDEREAMMRDPKRAARMFDLRKRELSGHMCLALKPVYVDRVAAWGYVRDWLRFRPAILPLQTEADRDRYLHDTLQAEGREAYEARAAEMRNLKPEILPKVLIWDRCVELDRCLKVAQHNDSADKDPSRASKREDVMKFNADENGENGDDSLESFRDGAIAFKEIEATMPKGEWVDERMAEAQEQHARDFGSEITDQHRLMQIAACQSAMFDKTNPSSGGSFSLPRASSSRHRVH